MPTLTVVFDDKVIIKDGAALHFEGDGIADFDAVVSTEGDSNTHAIQWNGTTGEIEYKGAADNGTVDAARVAPYIAAFDAEIERKRQEIKTLSLAVNAEESARGKRNLLLEETDWWAMSDNTMTQAQTDYRQALRDLPSSENWNPSWQWDDESWSATLIGVTWPTKP